MDDVIRGLIISDGDHPPHIVFLVWNSIVLMIDTVLPAIACRAFLNCSWSVAEPGQLVGMI